MASPKLDFIGAFKRLFTDYSIINVLWDVFRGQLKFSHPDVVAMRRKLCNVCPDRIVVTNQCSKCGCFLKGKTAIDKSKCSEGKW